MFTLFKINQAATFKGVAFLSCEPKTAFGQRDRQEVTKNGGVPKWEAQVVAMTIDQFGKPQPLKKPIEFGVVRPGMLADMVLVKRSRLSVQPVGKAEFDRIVKLARE